MDKKKDQIFVLFFSEIGFYLSWLPWNTLFLRMTLNSFLIFLFLLCKCTTTIWILHLLNFFLIHPLFFFLFHFALFWICCYIAQVGLELILCPMLALNLGSSCLSFPMLGLEFGSALCSIVFFIAPFWLFTYSKWGNIIRGENWFLCG